MALPRRVAPWWFLLCVAVVVGRTMHQVDAGVSWGSGGGSHGPQVQQAFLGFLILVGSLIWKGLEVAGRVTLEVLKWMVINLSLVVTKIGNGLKALGVDLLKGFRQAWDFLKVTYDHVLKPAWEKFWRWFDRFRKWLDTTFGPILKWLRRLRDTLLDFWKRYVRPWLDLIDVTRRALRVLNSLGLKWAGALDAKLAEIEDAIERPFRILLQKVNEIINLVDRVITGNGLLQRVALVRSLERDMRYAWRAAVNWRVHPVDGAAVDDINKRLAERTVDDVVSDARSALIDHTGPYESWATEMAATIARRLP